MFFTQQFNGLKVVVICLRIVKVVISNNGTDCTVFQWLRKCLHVYCTKIVEENHRGDRNASTYVIYDETTAVTDCRQLWHTL